MAFSLSFRGAAGCCVVLIGVLFSAPALSGGDPAPEGMTVSFSLSDVVLAEAKSRWAEAFIAGRPVVEITVPVEIDPITARVEAMNYDPFSGRFAAVVAGPEGRFRIGGGIWTEHDVPVPVRTIRQGEILSESDFAIVPMKSSQIAPRFVTQPENLYGMEAMRQVPEGRLVQASAIASPRLVRRNRAVTVIYDQGGIRLSLTGRSLQDGASGDMVRIMNVDTKKVLDAVVTGPDTATVTPF